MFINRQTNNWFFVEEKYVNAKTLMLGLYEIFHMYLFY